MERRPSTFLHPLSFTDAINTLISLNSFVPKKSIIADNKVNAEKTNNVSNNT